MADMAKEFSTFHGNIALSATKKASLRTSRDALRTRIRNYLKNDLELPVPKFRGQGSYSMDTTVNPLDGEYDIDDGVYLLHLDNEDDSEWPTPATVHGWLVKATDGHTNEKPMDKNTCVRVRYAGQYHVDLPSYGEFRGKYLLAEKGDKGWHESDPLAITDWFKDEVCKCGNDGQLRRLVRYLKAWADFQSSRRGKMPSGLILTVLAAENFGGHERDDVALAETASVISGKVQNAFIVYNPVDPSEKLTERLSPQQKERFQAAIADLASQAQKALDAEDAAEASDLWRGQFGDRFPKVDPKEKEGNAKRHTAAAAAAIGGRAPKPWSPKS